MHVLSIGCTVAACNQPQQIQVDLSADRPRFIVDHHGWPRPFKIPRVTEFAIGTEDDSQVNWHLKSSLPSGEPADNLAFVYGQVPPGFYQVVPKEDEAPKPLEPGHNYLVAAGGDEQVYRIVLALPVSVKPSSPTANDAGDSRRDRAD